MADILAEPRLLIIGCGRISDFHADAFKYVGFDLVGVVASPTSTRIENYASRHKISNVFYGVDDLINSDLEYDAVVIATPTRSTISILHKMLGTDVPILVEKPVAIHASELIPYLNRDLPVIVGYNRRFYKTVNHARDLVDITPSVIATLSIPEAISAPEIRDHDSAYLELMFQNSVHALDLAQHVLGELVIQKIDRLMNQGGAIVGMVAVLRSSKGCLVQMIGNWGAPANFSLTLDWTGKRFELKPFESALVYEGMEVIEPTSVDPIRRYIPKVVNSVELDHHDRSYKPGFVDQARALANMVNGESSGPAATLENAYSVLKLAEELVGELRVSTVSLAGN